VNWAGLGHDRLIGLCRRHGFDPQADLAGAEDTAPRLPFCYLFGRSFHTVSYYGANVYPENVTVGLGQSPVADWVTGKFVVEAVEDTDRNARLRITIELAPGQHANADRAALAAGSIRTQLRRLNSEFAHYVPAERQLPEVVLRPTDDPGILPGRRQASPYPPAERLTQTTESSPHDSRFTTHDSPNAVRRCSARHCRHRERRW
jgi:phenylacetate-CoA ligase